MTSGHFIKWCGHYTITAAVLLILCSAFPDFVLNYYSWTANVILYILIAKVTYHFSRCWFYNEKIEPINKAVLITGCDSGFGNALAKRLDSKGFHVFASCLLPYGEGAANLRRNCSNRLKVFSLDVTKDESVKEALHFVQENLGTNDLWAVVNNAGIIKGFCSEFSSIKDFKDTIEVNTLGPVRVTKEFLPLLKKSKGRVVNITSLAGRVVLMNTCAYTMSKYAAVAFTECLSQEMKEWGVHVISIEPELFRTGLTRTEDIISHVRKEVSNVSEDILMTYGQEYQKDLEKVIVRFLGLACFNIEIVVDSLESAITDKEPYHVYKPRRNILFRIVCYLMEVLPFEVYTTLAQIFVKLLGYPSPKDMEVSN